MEIKDAELDDKMKDKSSKYDDDDSHDESSEQSDEEILALAKKRFQLAQEAERDIRKEALDDLRFRAGDQWPEQVKNERQLDGRPCLTVNRIPQFVRQVTNDLRQNRPQIKVHPVDDKADIETAKIYQGLIKHIEVNSNADNAYDCAVEGAANKGFGYFFITLDWVSPTSFDQEILIKKIRNHFGVYLDPASKELDGSDAEWGMIFEHVAKSDFEEEYQNAELSQMKDWSSFTSQSNDWIEQERVRVAYYWYRTYRKAKVLLLENGSVVEEEDLKALYDGAIPENIKVIAERIASIPEVKYCKINGHEILEKEDWPGVYVPIVPVYGDELDIDGKRIVEGVFRHSKDSQRMLNYYKTNEAEAIALAPKSPYIVAEGQIPKQYEYMWATSNKKNHAFLPYKPVALNGQPVAPPQRNSFEPAIQALTQASLMAADDLKATTGVYDAALGARSTETSGIAIQRRTMQSQTSNFHLGDNLNTSIRHAGRIIVDLIPHVYDGARTAVIIGEDGEKELIRINQEFERNGKLQKYNLGVGKYDVVIEAGPSFATRRMEAAASMESISRSNPQLMGMVGDLIVKNMDWPGAQEMAERIRKTIPANILGEEGELPDANQLKSQLDQAGQMIDALTQKVNEQNKIIEQKTVEIESKERIAFAEMQVDLQKEAMKQANIDVVESLRAQMAQIEQRLMLLDINKPIDDGMNQFGSVLKGAGPNGPGPIPNQSTGGFSPGQPMEF